MDLLADALVAHGHRGAQLLGEGADAELLERPRQRLQVGARRDRLGEVLVLDLDPTAALHQLGIAPGVVGQRDEAPLDRAEGNDIDVIAQRYARDTGLELQTMQDLPTGGAPRKLALFMGEMQGMHVTQMATALIGPGYRVAVIVHMPATAVSQGETIQHLGAMLAVGITLPGKTKE